MYTHKTGWAARAQKAFSIAALISILLVACGQSQATVAPTTAAATAAVNSRNIFARKLSHPIACPRFRAPTLGAAAGPVGPRLVELGE